MFELRPYQKEAVSAGLKFLNGRSSKPGVEILPCGCHAKGYGILMYDGTIKKVEDIVVGDQVMGNDNTPRTVLELHKGRDEMYEITPYKGNPFVVNKGHIMSLYKTKGRCRGKISIEEISVEQYLNSPSSYKMLLRLRRPERSDFKDSGIELPAPYITAFDVKYVKKGWYYGFTTDGNHLYLDEQFFIHHNSGKSLIISKIAHELKKPVMVLQPSKEILIQNYNKAVSFGATPTIYSASCSSKELSNMTFATLKSVKNDIDRIKEIGISHFLVDECHSGYSANEGSEFMSFIDSFDNAKILGFTATPCKLHSYSSMIEGNYSKLNFITKDDPRFFEQIVHVTQIKELSNAGYWAKLKYEVWDFDDRGLRLNTTGSEYTDDSIKECVARSGLNNAIYKRILSLMTERKHILVCMDSVKSCEIMSDFINKKFGRISDVVTGKTANKKRDRIIEEFKAGQLKIIFNYSALATGFDFPELDCVVFGRPTFSYAIYYQFNGRGVRPHPDKKDALVIDCCNNFKRFGRVEEMSVEQFPSKGWCMFAGNNLISGIRMGDTVTKDDLLRKQNSRRTGVLNKDSRRSHPLDDTIMWFGKHAGEQFCNIPISYFRFLIDHIDFKTEKQKKIIEYYNNIII